jgi:hypothetical protein
MVECSLYKLAKVKMILFVVTVICTSSYQDLTALLKYNSDITSSFIWKGILHHKFVCECTVVNKDNTG